MFFLIKYGCILSTANKLGTDMEVQAFSDPVGSTVPVTVAEGDWVLELAIDPDTSDLFGKIWAVHDNAAWEDLTPNGHIPPGAAYVATSEDLDYQKGSAVVFLNNGQFVSLNLSQTLAVVDASIAAALAP